jgi:hypothetical protein
VGGCTLGVRAQASRKNLKRNFLGSVLWVVESACKGQVVSKGSSINKGKEKGHKDIQSNSRKEGVHSSRGTYPKEPISNLERSLQSISFLCIYIPCCISCLKNSIYIHSSQIGFPQRGFI